MSNKLITTTTDELEGVQLKYPEFMSTEAADRITALYNTIKDVEDELFKKRQAVWELENHLKNLKSKLNDLKNICEFKYKTKQFEDVIDQETISIKGLGNALIGESQMI